MSIALDLLGMSCFVSIPKAVVLSTSSGVLGCIYPISINMIRSSTAILAFTYLPAISDSDAELITLHKMLALTCIGALIKVHCGANGLVKSGLLPRKWHLPTWFLPPVTDKYEELEDIHKTISDALNVIDGLGYVAI